MNLLLDTHTLLWLLLKDRRLPRETALTIIDRSNTIFVSAISGFEVSTKVRIGKLPEAEWIAREFVHICDNFDFRELPLNNAHAVMAGGFKALHRDPFDRVLAAQAIIEDFLLVADDREMEMLGARVMWRG
jgi:PIN domain nuclease of toxin-antitoxin system